MATDIDVMYDVDIGFAEVVTTQTGTILGIFDDEYIEGDPGSTMAVMSSVPTLRTRDADALGQGDLVTVRASGYFVAEVEPDGNGETIHKLHRTA